jgi:Arc/MetJ-type ribon-helix-helix transcriptional regulator
MRIPIRYAYGMTIQITVRLDDEIVAFVDRQVALGLVRSRADAVNRAVARERRRDVAARDAAILSAEAIPAGRSGPDSDPDDLDGLARHAADVPLDLD